MNLGDAVLHFKGDAKDLEKTSMSVGNIVKGNLISSAITTGLSKVWGGIKNITSSVANLAVQGGFERALDIENAEHKLTGLGHSAEEVQGIMDNALASVKGTAYGMGDAATVAASAVAAGVKPGQDLERTLKLVGDAAAISGRDMVSMGAIFNKVASAGKMTGEELNQLTDSGIPMLQLLADNLGKTTEEVRDMVSAGEIGFDDFRNAIERGMGGAALKMGETFQGNLENTKAAMSRLGKEFMDPFLKGMTPALSTVIQIIDKITAGSTEGLDELGEKLASQLQEVITNVINKALPMIKNAIPVITKVLNQLIKAIPPILEALLPEIINVIMMIINSLVSLLPTLIPTLMNALIQAIQILCQMLPELIPPLIQAVVLVIQSLAEALPTLIPQLITAILDSFLMLLDNIDLILDCGVQLLMGLVDGIIAAIPILVEKMPEIIEKMIGAIIRNIPRILKAGWDLMIKLGEGIEKAFISIFQKFPKFGDKLVGGITSWIGSFGNAGKAIISGLWGGISSKVDWVISKIKGLGKSVLGAIKGIFGIHSPSTEFAWIGKMNMIGFEEGMEGMQPQIQDTIDSIFDLQPNVSGDMSSIYSPNLVVNVENNMELDPLGQVVSNIKTFSGGAKNDYNWGAGL